MSDKKLAIVILAAGQGTRMKSRLPKLLHPIAGAPMLSHVLATAQALDAEHVVTVVRHERDRIAEVVQNELPTSLIVDQDEIPGTGRAVEQAVDALPGDFDGDVLVVNGDVPLLDAGTLSQLIGKHRSAQAAATLLSAILDDATGYGRVIREKDGSLDRIIEQKDASAAELSVTEINAGVYVFTAAPLRRELPKLTTDNAQAEKYITDVIGALKASGQLISAVPVAEPWVAEGVNDRVQLSAAAARLNALIISGWQREGVTVQDPSSTWIDIKATLAPDVTIKPGTQILGSTTVASGAEVGPDTTLVDCEIGEDAVVKRTDATLAVIGAGASVGPFAYLRPNTVLDARGKIGTFVETKNSHIGAESKVPHLSYVGDATVGEGANIGAGTIFANYDGVNKHSSTIGSHVRTGSHNVFVAPITIGDGAYTGAGTVVRKDVPAGALAINVAPQRNMDGWVETNRPDTAAAHAAAAAAETEE
ncbi:bifunctional UDP-N-acetylglucosamine diphosphorylase/glucosamine-1-phosphate N-acetyltransferase GlmU [Microbacterium sp. MPKO10]|uniref:bifunctional UDP-N-acetylglucosamine diphosphorylase/glucosamine-1-phosphate N-acetyltransferase GlmU n=1 Tax=Microbacterium sp. MPKO10 TaxID=2989818 RepID=UPI0022362E10|nr:bifunctional UDP-N-acetylglucosamine diphosphorylase/glucosamine-1-phosphate N-acetyltransferase GlmU [Microbacterium sp. MPKO10]MCW4457907.1 bifunctional UDP-N-acetylglucosamine diphosphorylase/glucosamine-1-phosphate N-acetyltransferase GlmU [Microbacterium sp. MPKO10]